MRWANKPRIKWSAHYQHWFHYSSWVVSDTDRRALAFVIAINNANKPRPGREIEEDGKWRHMPPMV